jgi:hypothetical protein
VSTSGLDDKNVAFALNPIDGSVRWKIALAMQMKNTVATSVVSMNTKTVAFSGNDGTLLGVDVVTGGLMPYF